MSVQPTLGDLDVALLEATFNAVKPRGAELTAHFYEQLFAQHPAVIPLFANVKIEEQQGKLLSALALVVANLRHPDVLVPALQGLGKRHVDYGALAPHYDAVGGGLLGSLAHVAGPAWTPEAAKAWGDAYAVAAGVMIAAEG